MEFTSDKRCKECAVSLIEINGTQVGNDQLVLLLSVVSFVTFLEYDSNNTTYYEP